ncbi:NAD-dependent aldehyde dehydrogenase [Lentisphaera araneosa HTCC2155]|uniref:NAD-dependent aldehyde dehydrogenase n=1 Tax=Lentisphaera araneosa HTCC2155 TaxID=313628 RepID=A6DSV0_9BACT|nr:aldehyde dehydrogenase family protein [Lentisphaera araneosa]EDM25240.1 NAD-dependent aldehyde dehydrogenase [Lentisphaera araneosa HTCC2155]
MKHYPIYIGGREYSSDIVTESTCVYSQKKFAEVSLANPEHIEQAIEIGHKAKNSMKNLSAHQKRKVLLECRDLFEVNFEDLAETITLESGKTINESRAEMQRVISTFDYASIEVMKMDGEVLAMDTHANSEEFECLIKRFPKGLCTFITPFNFPINLIAHKVAPAIAAGCPFIIKPSDKTPICALKFAEILKQTSLPKEAFSVLPCSNEDSLKLVKDERISFLSFTGSEKVGWMLKGLAGKKSVCLELGGIASCAVYPDTDLANASKNILTAAFGQAGQSCISLQKLYIHNEVKESLIKLLVDGCKDIVLGDPSDQKTKLGPLINEDSLQRVQKLINQSVKTGTEIITGGKRRNNSFEPTILTKLDINDPISTQEVFAPLFIVEEFNNSDELFQIINKSPYGIHVGIYSSNIKLAMRAWNELECTSVVFGHVPTWRSDKMPYGGIKNSGCGREGLKYAIEEMTELKSLVIKK